jgi:hypothetical protein
VGACVVARRLSVHGTAVVVAQHLGSLAGDAPPPAPRARQRGRGVARRGRPRLRPAPCGGPRRSACVVRPGRAPRGSCRAPRFVVRPGQARRGSCRGLVLSARCRAWSPPGVLLLRARARSLSSSRVLFGSTWTGCSRSITLGPACTAVVATGSVSIPLSATVLSGRLMSRTGGAPDGVGARAQWAAGVSLAGAARPRFVPALVRATRPPGPFPRGSPVASRRTLSTSTFTSRSSRGTRRPGAGTAGAPTGCRSACRGASAASTGGRATTAGTVWSPGTTRCCVPGHASSVPTQVLSSLAQVPERRHTVVKRARSARRKPRDEQRSTRKALRNVNVSDTSRDSVPGRTKARAQ